MPATPLPGKASHRVPVLRCPVGLSPKHQTRGGREGTLTYTVHAVITNEEHTAFLRISVVLLLLPRAAPSSVFPCGVCLWPLTRALPECATYVTLVPPMPTVSGRLRLENRDLRLGSDGHVPGALL